jgi:peptide/histidine transporter 3/4
LQGILLLFLQARSDRLKPPMCDPRQPLTCLRVHGGNEVHLYLALYLIALGSGGIKAALPAHCADQFDAKHPKEKQQMSSCFNYLLLSLCTGGVVSVTLFLWIQGLPDRGWEKGFAAATGVMGLAVIVFIAGMPRYRIATVQGSSALKEICQVKNKRHHYLFATPPLPCVVAGYGGLLAYVIILDKLSCKQRVVLNESQ